MRVKFLKICAVALVLAAVAGSPAISQEGLVIGEIDIPNLRWGKQQATFEVTNNADWIKYITVEADLTFSGSYLTPERVVYTHHPLWPGQSITIKPIINIPGNYGQAVLNIRLYDVIDTLDQILPGQQVFEQSFTLMFQVPDEVQSYLQEGINLPPRVDNNPMWDNEFAHLLPLLLHRGHNAGTIADMVEADTSFVESVIEEMLLKKLLVRDTVGQITPSFAVITTAQAEATEPLVEETSDRLAALVTTNLEKYWTSIDSMVAAGSLSADSNAVLDGGTILYRPYPVISGMFLWYDLGRVFVAGSQLLDIYRNTDPCNAEIGPYMYVVHGGDVFNGHQFYNMTHLRDKLEVTFADHLPEIECIEGYEYKSVLKERRDYWYGEGYNPEMFMVDLGVVNTALRSLGDGVKPILVDLRDGLVAVSEEYGGEEILPGERYWIWNQVATRTLEKLIASGAVERRGNGVYKYMVMPG